MPDSPLLLHLKNWVFKRLFLAAPEFKPVGAGITLAYNAMRAFKQLDLDKEISEARNPITSFEICDEKGKTIRRTENLDAQKSTIYSIHRAELHKVLRSRLNTENIIHGKRLSDLTQTKAGYRLTFEDGTIYLTDYLIAADGIHSIIRNNVIPESRLRYSGYICWRGITDIDTYISKAIETWGSRGRFGIVPLIDNRVYWFACKNKSAGDLRMNSYGSGEILQIFKGYHEPIEKVIRNTRDENIIPGEIFDLKPIRKFVFGNLVLIGDAAHAMTPNMGQGACQAIEDAVVLAGCLQRESSAEEAFNKFEKIRLKRTHKIVKQSFKTGKIAQAENKLLISIRNLLMQKMPDVVLKNQMKKLVDVDFIF